MRQNRRVSSDHPVVSGTDNPQNHRVKRLLQELWGDHYDSVLTLLMLTDASFW